MPTQGFAIQEHVQDLARAHTIAVFLHEDWGGKDAAAEAAARHLFLIQDPALQMGIVAWGSVPVPEGTRMTPEGINWEPLLPAGVTMDCTEEEPSTDAPVSALDPDEDAGAGGPASRPDFPPLLAGGGRPVALPAPALTSTITWPNPADSLVVLARWQHWSIVQDQPARRYYLVDVGATDLATACTCGAVACEHWGEAYARAQAGNHVPVGQAVPNDRTCPACGAPVHYIDVERFAVVICARNGGRDRNGDSGRDRGGCGWGQLKRYTSHRASHRARTNAADPLYRKRRLGAVSN
ncbi:MAG: hypothetical protein KKA73_00675 [Chloroflexi bacterium]|nr:hypothetical protein [Chloroflexota bacterium]MBU1746176.1 hypothetical protein [Chloroflexota bacterium]